MPEPPAVRLRRARHETEMLRKREGVAALVVAPVTYLAVSQFGSQGGALDQLIATVVSVVAVLILFPLASLLRNYLQAPVRDLESETRQLRARVTELEKAAGLSTDDVRQALVELRTEVHQATEAFQVAKERNRYWKISEAMWPEDKAWKKHSGRLSRSARFRPVYEACSSAYARVERVTTTRSFRLFSGSEVKPEDDLPGAISELRAADALLGQEVDKLDREAGGG